MPGDNTSDTADSGLTNSRFQAVPNTSHSGEDDEWSTPLWDAAWEGDIGLIGDVHLCVAAKKWGDGTVDVLIAHDPYAECGVSTAYAHRHRNGMAPVTVHGPVGDVVETVTNTWGPPQVRKQDWDSE